MLCSSLWLPTLPRNLFLLTSVFVTGTQFCEVRKKLKSNKLFKRQTSFLFYSSIHAKKNIFPWMGSMGHFWQLPTCWNVLNSVRDLQSFRFVSNFFMSDVAKFYNSAYQTAFSKENKMDLSIWKIARVSATVVKAFIL